MVAQLAALFLSTGECGWGKEFSRWKNQGTSFLSLLGFSLRYPVDQLVNCFLVFKKRDMDQIISKKLPKGIKKKMNDIKPKI